MSSNYTKLVEKLKKIEYLNSIMSLLSWDEQVNLPKNCSANRSSQLSTLAELSHKEKTSHELGEILEILSQASSSLTEEQLCVVAQAKKNYVRALKLPSAFVAKKAEAESLSYHAWANARANDDFSAFSPHLQRQLDLAKEEASLQGYTKNPYDYQIDKHDPEMTAEKIESLFSELKKELIPLVDTIYKSFPKTNLNIFKGFPTAEQNAFLREVTEKLGFDYTRGRIDIALHPFCSGNGNDTRMTTRYDEDNPLDSLFSSIHETGHGLYEQGLPREYIGTALGEAVGMAVHESQSRIWENQVSRSKAFWKYWEPRYRKVFHHQLENVSSDLLYLAINEVSKNPIRVDSDEVHYNLHIILRFELEKKLFDGQLSVKDLPDAWNALSKELLGITPKNNAQGVLQDVHWSGGAFGYFPSYCLGNMLASQLWYCALKEIPNLEDSFTRGDFSTLLKWLNEKIHKHGKRYNTLELTKRATGEELSHKPLIRYLKERYLRA